ncbi:hypothetical protein WN51_11667 [Melipona quadrifasciata]|uniref:Uncharacterized protein n=1 Tax=Melipona quadrifasciata TaxID=166423 RepID=A0A0M9A4K0_9HYME|nr:hypothetical protein WN51_11667 [Melipona quadrifasciata]
MGYNRLTLDPGNGDLRPCPVVRPLSPSFPFGSVPEHHFMWVGRFFVFSYMLVYTRSQGMSEDFKIQPWNRPCAANNGAPGFTKLGPCLDRIKPLLGLSLENRVRSILEEFVCKSNSHYAKRFPRLKKFLNTVTTWTDCLDVSAKNTDIGQEMIKHAIEYLVKDGLVTQFADPVVLNRGPNKVDPDSLAAEQNRALKSMNVWRFINEKDYWLCQDCAACVDPETTLQIHRCKKVTSNSDLDVEVGSISQESSTFYSTCRTNSICSPISNRRIENPESQANNNCRNFQLIPKSSQDATNPQKNKFDNANKDSSGRKNSKTLDLKVKFNCGTKFAQTQTSERNLNFIFEASQSRLSQTPNDSSNVPDRSKPAPRREYSKGSDTGIRPGRVDLNLSCKTGGTASKSKTRWFLGRVPTCSNVHKRDSRRELVESCEKSNDRGSTKLLADPGAKRGEKFEEPRVASVCSDRDSMEARQIRRNEIENEREERKREVNFARKGEKQVDFVLTMNLQDDKDSVVPIRTDIERSEKCDITVDDDEICEGEIDRSRLSDDRGKAETTMGQCKAEETVDVSEKSEACNDGFTLEDSESKLIELYDFKCDCSSGSLKGDGFGERNSTTEDNLEECSRRALCTDDGVIEHDPSRTKNVGEKNSRDRSCHAFCTSDRMTEPSSNLDNKDSKVNHCHVICMSDRMVEHNLSRVKNVDNKNSKVYQPCRVPYTSDRVAQRNSSQMRNLDNGDSKIEHCPCYSVGIALKGQESILQEKKYGYVSASVSDSRTGEELLEEEERVFKLKQGISQMRDVSKQEIHVFDIKERKKDILQVEEKYSADSICILNSNSGDSHDTKCSCCGENIDGRNDIESNRPFICPSEKLPDSIMAENASTSQAAKDTSSPRRAELIVQSNVSSTHDQFSNRFARSEKNSIGLSQGCSANCERNDPPRNSSTRSNVQSSPITESLFVFCEGSNAKQFSSTDEESSSNEDCRANRRESQGKFKSPCRRSAVPAACRRKSIYSVTCDPSCTTRDLRNVGKDRSRKRKERDGAPIVSRCKNRSWRGSMVPGSLCGSFPAVDRIKYLIRKKLRKLLLEERDKGTSTSKTFLRNDRYLVSISSGKLNDSRVTRESCPAGSSIRCPFTTRNRYEARGSPERTFNEGSCLGNNKSIFGDTVRGRCQRMIRGNDTLKKIMIGDVPRPLGRKRDSKSTDTQDLMGERNRTKNPSAHSQLKNYSGRDRCERAFSRSSCEYKNGRGSNAEGATCHDKLRSFEKRLFKLEKRCEEENNFAVLLSDYEKRVNELDADFRLKLLQYVTLCRSVKNSLMKRLQPDDVYGVTSSSA